MKDVEIGTQRFTKDALLKDSDLGRFAEINFQNGPIQESDANGCHQEYLIAIVIDRLQHCF